MNKLSLNEDSSCIKFDARLHHKVQCKPLITEHRAMSEHQDYVSFHLCQLEYLKVFSRWSFQIQKTTFISFGFFNGFGESSQKEEKSNFEIPFLNPSFSFSS